MILMIAFIEGRMQIPMVRVTRDFLISRKALSDPVFA